MVTKGHAPMISAEDGMVGIAPDPAGARLLRLSAAVCVGIAAVLWMGPAIARPDLFEDDAAQHVFWLYRFADPSLFPDDISVEYFVAVAPWGYRALYAVLVPLMDAQLAAELFSVVLLVASAALAWRLGAALVPEDPHLPGLFACVTMLLLLPERDLLPPMALERAFAFPITLACLWALVARRYRWVGASWLAAALFYPPLLPVLGITGALVLLVGWAGERRPPPHWLWNTASGAAALAIALAGRQLPDGIGPIVTYEQARAMPEFGLHGRMQLFGATWIWHWFTHQRTGLGWSPRQLLPIAGAVLVALLIGRKAIIPRPAWFLLLAGVSLWAAARRWLFHLYLPERHLRWAIAAFAIVAFAAAGWAVVAAVFRLGGVKQRDKMHVRGAVALAAPLVVFHVLFPPGILRWRLPTDVDREAGYRFVASLPADALIAAHPDLADFVPLRARRSVLASTEGAHAYLLGYYERTRPRLVASLQAAFATSWEELDRVLCPYGVAVVLTHPAVWDQKSYYQPHDRMVRQLIARGERAGFVLAQPAGDRVVFRSGEVYVVRVECGPGGTG